MKAVEGKVGWELDAFFGIYIEYMPPAKTVPCRLYKPKKRKSQPLRSKLRNNK